MGVRRVCLGEQGIAYACQIAAEGRIVVLLVVIGLESEGGT